MKTSYRLVVFDWEGTLGDTLGHVLNALAVQAARLQFGELNEQLARQHVVLGLAMTVKKSFPDLSIHQHEQLLCAVQESLASTHSDVFLFPGVMEIVQGLHDAGVKLAIATNKGPQSLQRVLQASGLDKFFKVTRAAGQAPAKPCPQMLEEIMEEFGVLAADTLMVGDSVADIDMASQINVDAIGMDFYHQQKAGLLEAGALIVFDNYSQLTQHLELSTH